MKGGNEMAKKLSKNEIKNIMKDISPMIYIGEETHREKFKQVIYDGKYYYYIISSFGRIFSIYYGKKIYDVINLKEMHPTKNKKGENKGYYQCAIVDEGNSETAKIHKLVALAFIKNPYNLPIPNHLDGIKENNYVWNLEWTDNPGNTKHAYDTGLCIQPKGEERSFHKYTTEEITTVCELLEQNYTIKEISHITNVSKRMVKHLLQKDAWPHVVCNYDFSSYNFGKPYDYRNKVENTCKLLEENNLTLKEISAQTGITYAMVKNILNKQAYRDISDKYSISNFSNYQINKKKVKVQRLSRKGVHYKLMVVEVLCILII